MADFGSHPADRHVTSAQRRQRREIMHNAPPAPGARNVTNEALQETGQVRRDPVHARAGYTGSRHHHDVGR